MNLIEKISSFFEPKCERCERTKRLALKYKEDHNLEEWYNLKETVHKATHYVTRSMGFMSAREQVCKYHYDSALEYNQSCKDMGIKEGALFSGWGKL